MAEVGKKYGVSDQTIDMGAAIRGVSVGGEEGGMTARIGVHLPLGVEFKYSFRCTHGADHRATSFAIDAKYSPNINHVSRISFLYLCCW